MMQRKRPGGREKGVLLPVFSLPSEYGTGCFSQEARDFIDFLKKTGNTYWQILPLNPTGVADSPYQPLSSFAGNCYFIDPIQLVDQGLLSREELAGFNFGSDPSRVDYDALFGSRMQMLRLAYSRFSAQKAGGGAEGDDPFARFVRENAFWLEDFAIFMALRENLAGISAGKSGRRIFGAERGRPWTGLLRSLPRTLIFTAGVSLNFTVSGWS